MYLTEVRFSEQVPHPDRSVQGAGEDEVLVGGMPLDTCDLHGMA